MVKCKFCGNDFVKQHNSQKYCCVECAAEAKKIQDTINSKKTYIRNKKNKQVITATCEYCGEEFIKTHGNQKYCSKKCSENKNRELNNDAANKYYHHVKKQRGGDKAWGLGSGSLGPHCHSDHLLEHQKIQNELRRLKLPSK